MAASAVQTYFPPASTTTEVEIASAPSETAVGSAKAIDYWSKYFRSVLTRLFESVGGYTAEEQETQIQFLCDHVAPIIAGVPDEPYGRFNMPYNCSPLEVSVNLTTLGKPKARVWMNLGKPLDQSRFLPGVANRDLTVLNGIASANGSDSRWMNCLAKKMFFTDEQLAVLRARNGPVWPFSLFCFDFGGSNRTMRAYFPSVPRSGKTRTEVALESIASLEPFGANLQAGLERVKKYLANNKYDAGLHMLGVDCVDPEQARLKVYLDVNSNSWNAVKDVYTLGGTLDDEVTKKALEYLQSVYPLMRDEPEGSDDDWHKPAAIPNVSFPGQQFSLELTNKSPFPEVKIYAPLMQLAKSREAAEENMYAILRKLGHEWGSNGKLEETMRSVCGPEKVRGLGVVTFSYSKSKGAYSSFYFSPPTDYDDKIVFDYRPLSEA